MTILVTGGAGFIGRWVAQKLLTLHEVTVLDNLSNGQLENVKEFSDRPNFKFLREDILNKDALSQALKGVDTCIHLAAQINVQESIDYPERAFANNVTGTYNILEACRKNDTKLVLAGTCMIYDLASARPIKETDPINPKSPYAGSKAAAEELAISYYHGYNLPVVIVRPFNTFGPYQKSNMEGGVVNIFIKKYLDGENLTIFGDGEQTRDLLYVEDCADFILNAAFCKKAIGEVVNAGTGNDVSINKLALMICEDPARINHIPHHHPQSEIPKLICDYSKAKKLLGWEPKTTLKEGIEKTVVWMKERS